jgi:hypothetical protein
MIKMKILLTGFLMISISAAHAYISKEDVQKLRNDKEVRIMAFSKKEQKNILEKYQDNDFNKTLENIFYSSVREYANGTQKKCELNLISLIQEKLVNEQLNHDQQSLEEYLKALRVNQSIDDILYEIMTGISNDYFAFQELKLERNTFRLKPRKKKLFENNDIEELFSRFAVWPDDKDRCSYQEFFKLKSSIKQPKYPKKPSTKSSHLEDLILKAYKEEIIPRSSYHRLEYLRSKSRMSKSYIWLSDYLRNIIFAKNKMRPKNEEYQVINLADEDKFSSERIKRFSKITRRKLLYRKYDENQIIMLAQVLQKSSRRMGVDPDTISQAPYITQEFNILTPDGSRQTYVERIDLDPQSQYNLARRLLRKDVVELQMMETFNKVKITHEDVVMAAFETGYITIEDIQYVVKYDDLWNPNTSDFEKAVGFVRTVAGYGTFFLPPPWNITASIALGVIEGAIMKKHRNGAENDNPATFIE